MSTLYQTASQVRSEVSLANKLLMAAIVLFAAFLGACCVDTPYTTKRAVEGTVIAKSSDLSPELSKAGYGMLSVRTPNGTEVKVNVDPAHYKHTELGAQWSSMESDSSLGLPMPLQNKLLAAIALLSALGSLGCVVWLLRLFDYSE